MSKNSVYLGDGVYAEFDGHGIWLRANDYENPTDKIYIEPSVWFALLAFVDGLSEKTQEGE